MVPARSQLLVTFSVAGLATLCLSARHVHGHGVPPTFAPSATGAAEAANPAIVVLPDTQYYASTFPEVFRAQTKWIAAERDARHIVLAVHLGDVVDRARDEAQWEVASAAMGILSGRVPYLLVSGNHDTDADRGRLFDRYFAPSRMPWLAGTLTEGSADNSYLFVDIGARRWLVLGLEFGPRDATLGWAAHVLKAYASVPAIVVTHAYLYRDGTRYGTSSPGADDTVVRVQQFAPEAYGYTAASGINDGEQVWRKLVLPNRNVKLVLCGHDNGVARLTSIRPDGSRVHQVLSDYQWLYQGTADYAGGSGFLRILEVDDVHEKIHVRTYSPYLDRSLTDAANQFELDLGTPKGPALAAQRVAQRRMR
jgi:hypothetical protein